MCRRLGRLVWLALATTACAPSPSASRTPSLPKPIRTSAKDPQRPPHARESTRAQKRRVRQMYELADAAEAAATRLENASELTETGELSVKPGTGRFSGIVRQLPGQGPEISLCSMDFSGPQTSLDWAPGVELRSGDYVEGTARLTVGPQVPLQRRLEVLVISMRNPYGECPRTSALTHSLNAQRAAELRNEARNLRDVARQAERNERLAEP